ncbi:MAG: GNAT family N-acetyltransferase [Actinomycetota bacterium]|nr:GNAT family N-acetyltransferase [Actinomycetota bacterium]
MPAPAYSLVAWGRDDLAGRRDEILDVYAEAMGVDRAGARSRRSILTAHLDRAGLRGVAAVDTRRHLVGVAYGYLGAPGQWWHDQVRLAMTGEQADRWLRDAFEVCELHVRPRWQGRGLGKALLDSLLAGPPAATAVLTTPDVESRARGFYRLHGWQDLVRDLIFPGDPRSFAVLGKDLDAG